MEALLCYALPSKVIFSKVTAHPASQDACVLAKQDEPARRVAASRTWTDINRLEDDKFTINR